MIIDSDYTPLSKAEKRERRLRAERLRAALLLREQMTDADLIEEEQRLGEEILARVAAGHITKCPPGRMTYGTENYA